MTCRGTLLIVMGLIYDCFGIFSMYGEKYYFCIEGSMSHKIEPMQGEIEMNIKMNIPARWEGVAGSLARLEKKRD